MHQYVTGAVEAIKVSPLHWAIRVPVTLMSLMVHRFIRLARKSREKLR